MTKVLAWLGLGCMALFLLSVVLLLFRGDQGSGLRWMMLWLGGFLVTGGGAVVLRRIRERAEAARKAEAEQAAKAKEKEAGQHDEA